MDTQEERQPQDPPYEALSKENADKVKRSFWKNSNLILTIAIGTLSIIILLYPFVKPTPPPKPPDGDPVKANVKAKVLEPVSFENIDILVTSIKAGSTDSQSTVSAIIKSKDGDTMQMTIQRGGRSDFSGYAITIADISVSEQSASMFITQSSIK
jgi:hypothetical protein